MRRIVLFSTPYNNTNFHKILNLIFPPEILDPHPLFMPSQGISNTPQNFLNDWEGFSKKSNVILGLIDNCAMDIDGEKEKLRKSNILIISGGDPFQLLINLRRSGMDTAIREFVKKDEFILAGYSAGAYVLTPTIEIAKIFNENYPGGKKYISQDKMKDFTGLGIIDFEVCAHYSEAYHKHIFENYIEKKRNDVKLLSDNDFIILDL
ncbi:MAG: Type 1 glutamine amidotransferase-like domain-containing protein [Promethearchaeota archaeon]